MLENISIILVEPTHPGNIGAVARAIKTMGINSLRLVNPKKFPHYEATKRAAGAESVLQSTKVYPNLTEAVADATLLLGTSVRDREVAWPTLDPRQAAKEVADHAVKSIEQHKIGILFGRESSGLSNDELAICHHQLRIPANLEYSSLNLASAVQIVCYEMRMAFIENGAFDKQTGENNNSDPIEELSAAKLRQLSAPRAQLDGHLQHLLDVLQQIEFAKSDNPEMLIRKLTRLYNKAQLSVEEVQILRGILSAIQDKVKRSEKA